jgi:hypothetical protein
MELDASSKLKSQKKREPVFAVLTPGRQIHREKSARFKNNLT